MTLLRNMLAFIGTKLLALRLPLTEYGLFLVFRYGSAKQAEGYIEAALAERTARQPKVIFVPVMTDPTGVPTGLEGKGKDEYTN